MRNITIIIYKDDVSLKLSQSSQTLPQNHQPSDSSDQADLSSIPAFPATHVLLHAFQASVISDNACNGDDEIVLSRVIATSREVGDAKPFAHNGKGQHCQMAEEGRR